jgi:polysaccharide deacetylase 2 family uncharacterized protein YibQ
MIENLRELKDTYESARS